MKFLKFGKEGIELETITKQAHYATREAESAINTLKELAVMLSGKLSEAIARTGRWDSGYNVKELYEFKLQLHGLLSKLNIDNIAEIIPPKISEIILFDLSCEIEKIKNNISGNEDKRDELNQIILNEIECFKKDDWFKDKDFLDKIVNKKL